MFHVLSPGIAFQGDPASRFVAPLLDWGKGLGVIDSPTSGVPFEPPALSSFSFRFCLDPAVAGQVTKAEGKIKAATGGNQNSLRSDS